MNRPGECEACALFPSKPRLIRPPLGTLSPAKLEARSPASMAGESTASAVKAPPWKLPALDARWKSSSSPVLRGSAWYLNTWCPAATPAAPACAVSCAQIGRRAGLSDVLHCSTARDGNAPTSTASYRRLTHRPAVALWNTPLRSTFDGVVKSSISGVLRLSTNSRCGPAELMANV